MNATRISARAFAPFTGNQRQCHSKPLAERSIVAFGEHLEKTGTAPAHVLPYDSYLINLGHRDNEALAE